MFSTNQKLSLGAFQDKHLSNQTIDVYTQHTIASGLAQTFGSGAPGAGINVLVRGQGTL